ncbi:MAG: DUF4097 family beta strand repeat protein [Acidobacteria bacterium]|nr:DUF4097 family beta strand repeat protein [Acidobacteriota bacterium]
MHLKSIVALAALAASPAFAFSAQEAEEEFNWAGSVARGDHIEIQNLNGPIAAEYTSGDRVEVVAYKEGPRDHIEEVDIEVVEHANGVTICSVYPNRDGRSNVCGPGDDANLNNNGKNKTRVTFTVRVPAGVDLIADTMNGRVTTDDMQSNLRLETMNGAITADSTGWIHAETMNGAVDVAMGSADWTGGLELSSMNGSIEVALPGSADVDVDAETMNGRVTSDFDGVEIRGRRKNHANGTIGSGGRDLDLSTMNGSIRIRRSR